MSWKSNKNASNCRYYFQLNWVLSPIWTKRSGHPSDYLSCLIFNYSSHPLSREMWKRIADRVEVRFRKKSNPALCVPFSRNSFSFSFTDTQWWIATICVCRLNAKSLIWPSWSEFVEWKLSLILKLWPFATLQLADIWFIWV